MMNDLPDVLKVHVYKCFFKQCFTRFYYIQNFGVMLLMETEILTVCLFECVWCVCVYQIFLLNLIISLSNTCK